MSDSLSLEKWDYVRQKCYRIKSEFDKPVNLLEAIYNTVVDSRRRKRLAVVSASSLYNWTINDTEQLKYALFEFIKYYGRFRIRIHNKHVTEVAMLVAHELSDKFNFMKALHLTRFSSVEMQVLTRK
ncbi:hypothetical protein [Thaumasiovibrio subtropicus]|uniref:hypothetical protein n=1 Tax=Thaumasiovibrio subtropicus TaxID=1891207 RepID=UPI000B35372A|nr:hypothetical protein [Thaumasiovibrio subtropicus]